MLILHHLETSRSSRIIWLMEELGIAYELVRYARDRGRAPAALTEIHPLGKAPILVDGDLVISESSAILRYIDARYGQGRFSPPPGTPDGARHDEWLDFAEGSATQPLMLLLMARLHGGLPEALEKSTQDRFTAMFDYIQTRLGAGPFLMGEQLTLADMQMLYTVEIARVVGLLGDFPGLQAYLDRLNQQPGLCRAIEIGGALSPDQWG